MCFQPWQVRDIDKATKMKKQLLFSSPKCDCGVISHIYAFAVFYTQDINSIFILPCYCSLYIKYM